ncbi:MAG: hypothetical protein NTZ17_01900 [Phycisphaerae bacterium]|nr:hypothetical protein [Phycisphaerae bacterium]
MATDTHNAPRLDGVREEIREPLRLLVERLQAGLGDNLKSISVVGSSLTQEFRPKISDINTVVLLDAYNSPALSAVALLAPQMSRQRLSPPLLMTAFYIRRSCDVFGVEFLDFQLVHETILGADPFAALQFDKKNVRLQCERELKAMLVRLRQGYLASAGNKRMLRDILISTAKGLAPLLRAMLWLQDTDRPKTMDSTLRKAAGQFNGDLSAALAAHQWRHEKSRVTDAEMESTFVTVLDVVDHLTTIVDALER